MPNELVRWGGGDGSRRTGTADLGRYEDLEDEEWDLPPVDANVRPVHDASSRRNAAVAERDAVQARREGDTEFAVIRESDAGDERQTMWDWGDLRTWLWFAAMFFGFLLLVAACYFMPEGRHASPPEVRIY